MKRTCISFIITLYQFFAPSATLSNTLFQGAIPKGSLNFDPHFTERSDTSGWPRMPVTYTNPTDVLRIRSLTPGSLDAIEEPFFR